MDKVESARPFIKAVSLGLKLVQLGGFASTADLLKNASEMFSRDRSKYLLDVVISEVRHLLARYDQLDARQRDFLDTDWLELLGDADRKARVTRARDRILRIGKIISSAAYEAPPARPDATEELMRVAMNLDDQDVVMLKNIVDHQGKMLGGALDRVDNYSAYSTWTQVAATARNCGISHGEMDAICGKLESFGLVSRGERTTNIHGKDPVPFALLRRGLRFLEQAQFSAAQTDES